MLSSKFTCISASLSRRSLLENTIKHIGKYQRKQRHNYDQYRTFSQIAKHDNNKNNKLHIQNINKEKNGNALKQNFYNDDKLKVLRVIRAASRACYGDLQNFELQSIVQKAKYLRVPGERILEAVESGECGGGRAKKSVERSFRFDSVMETSCGKVNFIILTLSNNRARTERVLASIINKFDGRFLPSGFNNRFFVKVGIVHVRAKIPQHHLNSNETKPVFVELIRHPTDESRQETKEQIDEIVECCSDGGAKEFEFRKNIVIAKCKDTRLEYVVKELYEYGFEDNILLMEHQYMAKSINKAVKINENTLPIVEKVLELLKADRDVIHVFHNAIMLDY